MASTTHTGRKADVSVLLASVCMLSFVLAPCTLGQSASFDGVGHLPGGGGVSAATAVSGDGSVVVGSSDSSDSTISEAFRWTSSGGIVGMGDLPGDPFRSGAYGVSSNGAVIAGFGYVQADSNEDTSHAFRWTLGGGIVDLGILDGGDYSVALGISADGLTVVGEGFGDSGYEAFQWTAGAGMVGLGDLPGGPFESQAKASSASGSVVVGRGRTGAGFEAFRWTVDGGMVGLGDLPGGSVHSDAQAVGADGTVVVGVSHSGNFEAFRWTAKDGMVGLGSVGSGSSFAHAVTADGSIVVGSYILGANGPRAAYWTAEDGMVDLRGRLVDDYDLGLDLAGWTLTHAWGISDDGLTIVGRGINESGDIEGWVAQLPESTCFGDVDGNGNVGASDLLALLAAWGTDPGGPPDLDGDGNVGASDLLALLNSWGPCA
ncbi:MAG: hypothetical protein V3T53_14985 [Phycisphaerales bacterium]